MLQEANLARVGPRLLGFSKNFLVMELVHGTRLFEWLESMDEKSAANLRGTVRTLLKQAWTLDRAGIDHGELSRAPKNVIIGAGGKPKIIDFESASASRRTSNVTSVAQYLLVGGAPSKRVRRTLRLRGIAPVIRALREYKQNPSKESLDRVLYVAKLSG